MNQLQIPLGPFVLDRMIGVGGAGEVWRGVHVRQQVPVAVKVITAARARHQKYRDAFHNEVRAVAGLSHPGVVTVLEVGVVDEAAEHASLGRMVAESPFLAMELAPLGSLRTAPLPTSYVALRDSLLWLLDVLAHAHANGVIHRDLKPGNVLVFDTPVVQPDPSGASRLRLTDFGLAHASDRAERVIKGTSGTPIFMAPEQFRGQWRDFGPWTDLYALGCMAYTLATGRPPFQGRGVSALMQAHLSAQPPPLQARIPVPAGFEAWVQRLVAKEPIHRFQRAADAMWSLMGLGEPEEPAESATPKAPVPRALAPAQGTLTRTWPDWEAAWRARRKAMGEAVVTTTIDDEEGWLPRRVPPLPSTWRRGSPGRPDMRLVGAGLGLYGLRTIPLVDRELERDRIWDLLSEVRDARGVRMVLLRGAAGTGKSRLAQWITQRADEVGNAVVLRAVHSASGGPSDGLARMVAGALGAVGLGRQDLRLRIEEWLRTRGITDPYEWRALTELIWPSSGERPGEFVQFGSANERYALIQRLLGYLAGRPDRHGVVRPVVIWLDDIQWGRDALGFAGYLLDRVAEGGLPVLVLMTARDEALTERSEGDQLEELLIDPRVNELPIDPLGPAERRELVEELLGLEGDLAAQVDARTGGNPLFAVQLVGDWVQRGVLMVSESGFVLRPGERAILPDDLHALWAHRLQRVLHELPSSARTVLELAALIGTEVDEAEWQGACRIARLDIPHGLLSALMGNRLAHDTEHGWAFTHGMLRESLERASSESGRAPELHDAVATTLRIRYDVAQHPGIAARLGRHLYLAGRREEALAPLHQGAIERRGTSDYAGAMELVALRRQVLEALGVPATDPRWGEELVMRADLLIGQGRLEQAREIAQRCIDTGTAHGWDRQLPMAHRLAGTACAKLGRITEAERWLVEGERLASHLNDELEVARALQFRADVCRLQGHADEALQLCRRALGRFSALEEVRGQADVLNGMSAVHMARGEVDQAEDFIRKSIPLYQAIGVRYGEAVARNTLGDILRRRGQPDQALRAYRASEAAFRSLGSPEYLIPQLNLGQILLDRCDYVGARRILEPVLEAFERSGRRALQGALHAFLLPCIAHESDWGAWGDHIYEAISLLEGCGFVDTDIARAVEDAGRVADEAGLRHCAAEAYRLACQQWRGLGESKKVALLEQRIETLTTT